MPNQAMLCPQCRKLISADEPVCPYCGVKLTGPLRGRSLFSLSGQQLIRLVIYANIAMFALSLLIAPRLSSLSANPMQLLSPDSRSLLWLGATGALPIGHYHRWWSLLSANYLHGNLLHIVFNMLAFRQLSTLTLVEYGVSRTFSIYTLSGIIGFYISYVVGIPLTIGASAAVCGLMGALLYYGISRGGVYGQALYRQVGGWIVTLFLFGLLIPGINNWGHGGGILAGAGLGYLMGYSDRQPEKPWHRRLAGVCMLATAAVLIWAVASSILLRLS